MERLLLASRNMRNARAPLMDVVPRETSRPRSMSSKGTGSKMRDIAASIIRTAAMMMSTPSISADMFSAF